MTIPYSPKKSGERTITSSLIVWILGYSAKPKYPKLASLLEKIKFGSTIISFDSMYFFLFFLCLYF